MAELTHYLLTPKNIYRLLTGRLSGLFSYVFPEERLRGMTLIRFWREELAPIATEETLDALLPLDGSHPRVQSNMMNRSGSSASRLLRTELDSGLNAASLSRLIRHNMRFLTRRGYRADLFANLLTDFENLCFRDDFFIPPVVREYLLSLRAWQPSPFAAKRQSPRLFHDACRLSWLCAFSLYGQMMNCDALTQRCLDASLLPDGLWSRLALRLSRAVAMAWAFCAGRVCAAGAEVSAGAVCASDSPGKSSNTASASAADVASTAFSCAAGVSLAASSSVSCVPG